ncbi:tetratricopeptide repeat protein [Kitasatospora purpeofusca]|uniref:tetratricopeptide repeat protein n=1 Tax=Kitasatospora purpeofusca TaxID=67352 RepID=UPI0036CEDBC1
MGTVPPLASAFQRREGLQEEVDRVRARHATVLTQVLSGGGGVGKSQLAAACAWQAHAEGVDVLVWVNAAETSQIVAAYAQAAARIAITDSDGQDAEVDATAFLDWLAITDRTWMVVLDDLTDIEGVGPWWPRPSTGDNGRVLATTRRRDALVSGAGRAVVEVGVYTEDEACAYLGERLAEAGGSHLLDDLTGDLIEALGRLPLALAHAAAYMINEDVSCTRYLALFTARTTRLDAVLPPGADTEGYGRRVTASLLLALDAAQQREPVGLANPAIRIAALLDPAGHPRELWDTDAVADYLTAHRTPLSTGAPASEPVRPEQARAALRLLHHYALLTSDSRGGDRSVRLHALTSRAAQETTLPADAFAAVRATAGALREIWPKQQYTALGLTAVLRANTDALTVHAGDLLWESDSHLLLFFAGSSLIDAGQFTTAVAHWHRLVADSKRMLGEDHPDTLTARANLGTSYQHAGRTAEAIDLLERVVADRRRVLGGDHPDTLTARANLAISYRRAGRTAEAIGIEEQVVADRRQAIGEDHPDTLTARANLASSYQRAGRTAEAIDLLEQVVADRRQALGDDHPDTLIIRANLAFFYQRAGRTTEAIDLLEQVVWDTERVLGGDHPVTLTARNNLATSYQQAGRNAEAIDLLEDVAADVERVLRGEHPDALAVRANLAASYQQAGRTAEAMRVEEQMVADSVRLFGSVHPDTLAARNNLATSYWRVGRTAEAISIEEQVVADRGRTLGDKHPATLIACANLGTFYWQSGRIAEAIELLEQVVVDTERVLGGDHLDTLTARTSLASSYQRAGRIAEAIELLEQVVVDTERVLGGDHPDTLTACNNLAVSYQGAGRITEAIDLLERVVAGAERVLGGDHPDTRMIAYTLRSYRMAQGLVGRTHACRSSGRQGLARGKRAGKRR